MEITSIETLLGITIADKDKPVYAARLASAVAHINKLCRNRFSDPITNVVTLPVDVQMGAALLVQEMGKNKQNGIASRTLSDMSTSFFEGGAYRAAATYWKPYRKVRMY